MAVPGPVPVFAAMRGFLAGLDDDDLARGIAFAISGGPKQTMALGDLMQHGAIHAVPGDFDLLFYADDRDSNPRP